MRRPTYYRLDGKTPVPTDMYTWATSYDDPRKKRVAITRLYGHEIAVSTVFLGLDHNWSDGPPILFETMVFALAHPKIDELTERYHTWEEAETGHAEMVERVKAALAEERGHGRCSEAM